MNAINAIGKTASEAVAITQAALKNGAEKIQVRVDGASAAFAVKRLLEGQGFKVGLQDDDGRLILNGSKVQMEASEAAPKPQPQIKEAAAPRPVPQMPLLVPAVPQLHTVEAKPGSLAVLIAGDTLGRGGRELGEILLRSFLGTLVNLTPSVVALINDGVKLALFDSATCDHLKALEALGTRVLVCGISANHLGVNDGIGAGVLSSMADILAAMNGAEKIMTL